MSKKVADKMFELLKENGPMTAVDISNSLPGRIWQSRAIATKMTWDPRFEKVGKQGRLPLWYVKEWF